MKSFKRIKVLAEVVDSVIVQNNIKDAVVADIAADHGYLSELLSRNEKIKKIYATDISQKCLDKVVELIKNNNLTKIETKLGDGLSVLEKNDISVLAGIGGYEIIKILNYQNITKNNLTKCDNFVLQPSKNVVELRKWLIEKNIEISRDFIVKSGEKFYPIIVANFKNKNTLKPDIFNIYFGKDNTIFSNDFCEFLIDEIDKLKFLEKMSKFDIENSDEIKTKYEIFMLAKNLLKNKGD